MSTKTFFCCKKWKLSLLFRYSLCNPPNYSAPLQFNQTYKKKKNQISYFPYVQTDIVEASLKKSLISLITGNWTSFNVPPLSDSPRDLKSYLSLKTKKFWVFLYPRTVFFPEAQAEKADKRSWFDWAVPSLAFFSFLGSLARSLSRSLAPSMATFPSSLGGAPACASLSEFLFSKRCSLRIN